MDEPLCHLALLLDGRHVGLVQVPQEVVLHADGQSGFPLALQEGKQLPQLLGHRGTVLVEGEVLLRGKRVQ